MSYGFSKKERLLKRSDFARVSKLGTRLSTKHFLVLVASGPGLGHHRLGITVGRHVGGAVFRNRIKRLVREYFRLNKREILPDSISTGADIVVIAKAGCPYLKLDDVTGELEACWPKL